jgi:biopolymer transport protein TolR
MSDWRVRRAKRFKAEINVVPYIDVMLVLLIIFMVSAPLIAPSVVNLPSVGSRTTQPAERPVELVIDKAGVIVEAVDRETSKPLGSTRIEEIASRVLSLQAKAEKPVVISADKDVRYEAVLKVMDELQRKGVKRVGLSVKPAS